MSLNDEKYSLKFNGISSNAISTFIVSAILFECLLRFDVNIYMAAHKLICLVYGNPIDHIYIYIYIYIYNPYTNISYINISFIYVFYRTYTWMYISVILYTHTHTHTHIYIYIYIQSFSKELNTLITDRV